MSRAIFLSSLGDSVKCCQYDPPIEAIRESADRDLESEPAEHRRQHGNGDCLARYAFVLHPRRNATRKETKVLKKPLASWMPLVARISAPICARINPLGRIGPPFLLVADRRSA